MSNDMPDFSIVKGGSSSTAVKIYVVKSGDSLSKIAPPPAPAPAPAPIPAGIAVSSVATGNAIGADNMVTVASDSFSKSDTMYVSVNTTGSGITRLDAEWTYRQGENVTVVKEDSMTIDTTGPATHEFHVSKPDGWPAGDYEVEVMLDGKSAGSKKLTVK